MNFSAPFIRRPIGTTLMAIGLFLVGAVAYAFLPVASLPSVEVSRAELQAGLGVLAAFVKAGLATSNGEARRAVANNAILVNDVRVTNDKAVIGEADVTPEGVIKLSLGRKRHVLLKPV